MTKGRSKTNALLVKNERSIAYDETDDLKLLMSIAKDQAQTILDRLAFLPFDAGLPIVRNFRSFPELPGIYAVRHRTEGLLYLGKTNNLNTRFNGGHKAFTWAWLDLYNPHEVRIMIEPIDQWGKPTLLLEIEAILLRATEPPYNVKIPMER
jgi:GIY-YIG catalytic domain